MIPTQEEIESYLESVEEFLFSSVSSVTNELPNVREAAHRLWLDVSRYGPASLSSLQDIHIPGLGNFEVPAPPPPPPPKSWLEESTSWCGQHPWKTSGIVVGVIGVGLLAGYVSIQAKYAVIRKMKAPSLNERRQVVVVLGGESNLALALIMDLENKGYIVITSVPTPGIAEAIELKCHGYVRALVLDPTEPATVPVFLRSLTSTLSRRFPLNAHGDPYASPSSYPYIHSVISLLTFPSSSSRPQPAPLEQISLQNDYLPYLISTHITPLQVLQALMPLLRTTPARSRDASSNSSAAKSIIICVPAPDARVGLAFASTQAMSAVATLRGAEVLRREIKAAALTDKSDSMKNIKVVIIDVGAVGVPIDPSLSPQDVYKAMEDWTPSEKLAYGAAFSSILQNGTQYGMPRAPASLHAVTGTILEIVSGGQKGQGDLIFKLGLGKLRNWIRGERFSVGAGARTYTLASYLPRFVLDGLLHLPHLLISIRNALLPIPTRATRPPSPSRPKSTLALMAAPPAASVPVIKPKKPLPEKISSDPEEASETGSEADVENNSDDGSGVESSWVSLKATTPEQVTSET